MAGKVPATVFVILGTVSELQFRPATVSDAKELAALVNSCYRGDSSRLGWTTEADLLDGTRTDAREIEAIIARPRATIITCSDGNEIIGSVNVENRGTECYLGMLVVKPTLQRGGLGRKLIQAAEDYARDTWHSEKMTMTVISRRAELIAYYERRGYRRTGETKPFKFDDVHGIARVDGIELEVLEKDLT